MMNKSMGVNLRKRTAGNQIVSSVAKKYFPKELKRTLFIICHITLPSYHHGHQKKKN